LHGYGGAHAGSMAFVDVSKLVCIGCWRRVGGRRNDKEKDEEEITVDALSNPT
jgi:hypothetical protein